MLSSGIHDEGLQGPAFFDKKAPAVVPICSCICCKQPAFRLGLRGVGLALFFVPYPRLAKEAKVRTTQLEYLREMRLARVRFRDPRRSAGHEHHTKQIAFSADFQGIVIAVTHIPFSL